MKRGKEEGEIEDEEKRRGRVGKGEKMKRERGRTKEKHKEEMRRGKRRVKQEEEGEEESRGEIRQVTEHRGRRSGNEDPYGLRVRVNKGSYQEQTRRMSC